MNHLRDYNIEDHVRGNVNIPIATQLDVVDQTAAQIESDISREKINEH